MIFYEAPHKFINTIGDLHRVLGDREIAIVRELTKVHEQVVRTTLAQAEKDYTENKIKGGDRADRGRQKGRANGRHHL